MSDPVVELARKQRLEQARNAEQQLAQQVVEALGFNLPAPPHGYENFAHWAKRCGVRSLPAKPATVAGFVLDSFKGEVPFQEITQQLAAISACHDFSLLANPVRTAIVAAALEAIAPAEVIKAPLSWRKAEQADWHTLPAWVQAIISRREGEREKQLTRRLQEIADERKANEVQEGGNGKGNGAGKDDTCHAGTGSETKEVGAVA
jgi:hypothetical protein